MKECVRNDDGKLTLTVDNYFASVDLEKAFDHVPQSYLMGNTETYS